MYSHFENIQTNLNTTLQSAEKGKEVFEKLRQLSFDTTFGVDELASATTQFLNSGVGMEQIEDSLLMIGNLAQGDKQKFTELTNVYSKVMSLGRAGSEQLEMIALRGIPIRQILKDMGVEGTASAKDITKAFESLTEEGGRFYNAMNNINETIEGRQGFVDDTLKELKVNFAEVTNIADLFKLKLDVTYEVVQKITDILAIANENPIMKALITGVLVATVTSITTVLLSSVVPALVSVIAKLKIIAALRAALDFKTMLLGLSIGAVVGGVTALSSWIYNQSKVTEEINKTNASLKDTLGLQYELKNLTVDSTVEEKNTVLEMLENQLKAYEQQKNEYQVTTDFNRYFTLLDNYENKIKMYESKIKQLQDSGVNSFGEQIMTSTGRIENKQTPQQREYQELVANLNSAKNSYSKLMEEYDSQMFYKGLSENIEGLKKEIELNQKLNDMIDNFKDYNPVQKYEVELSKLTTKLDEIKDAYDLQGVKSKTYNEETGVFEYEYDLLVNVDPEYKKKIDTIKNYIEDKLQNTKISIAVESQEDWQKTLQKAFGFSGKDVLEGATSGTVKAFDTFTKQQDEMLEKFAPFMDDLGLSSSSFVGNSLQAFQKAVNELLKSDTYSGTEESLTKVGEIIAKIKNNYSAALVKDLEKQNSKLKEILGSEKSREQILLEIYALQNGVSINDAQRLIELNNENIQLNTQVERLQRIKELTENIKEGNLANNLQELGLLKLEEGDKSGIKDYAKGSALNSLSSSINGTDVGTFLSSVIEKGDPMIALMDTLFNAIVKVVGGVEGLEIVLNPISDILEAFEPLIKTILIMTLPLKEFLNLILKGVEWLVDLLFGDIADAYDDYISAQKEQTQNLKDMNEEYKKLLTSMKEQEEYYLEQKRVLNANTYAQGIYNVNDMILTPHGNFSTAPDDYIIATKNPYALGQGNVNVQINNTVSDNVDVDVQRQNDELIVTISRKVAEDYATGKNGWNNALNYRQSKINGRRVQ